MRLHRFLSLLLEGNGATFLITKGLIEIVPAKVTKSCTSEGENGRVQLNEVVAKLAEDYDLNILVAPQAGGAKTGLVTTRLLNVPADTALQQIAIRADLRVVRTGNTFLRTSKEHANELFKEKLDKERQKAELGKLRVPPPAPEK